MFEESKYDSSQVNNDLAHETNYQNINNVAFLLLPTNWHLFEEIEKKKKDTFGNSSADYK